MKHSRNALFAGVLLLLPALQGCGFFRYLGYQIAPHTLEEKEAEYAGLTDHSVVVVVDAPPKVFYDYPDVRSTLGAAVSAELFGNIDNIRIVHPSKAVYYQDNNPYWKEEGIRKLGKAVESDYVLTISLMEYTSRAPGMYRAIQGRILADAELYALYYEDADQTAKGRVWHADNELSMIYPPRPLYNSRFEANVLAQTEQLFARKLVKHFRKYKVKSEDF